MYVYNPTREMIESTNIFKFAKYNNIKEIKDLYARADSDPEWFWDSLVRYLGISFFRNYDKVIDTGHGNEMARWFVGGRVNIAYNAVERYSNEKKAAIIYESEDGSTVSISYKELDQYTGKLAGSLKKAGIKKGDRVGIYMPFNAKSVIAFYSVLRTGAVAVPMFSGYGGEAVGVRSMDAGIKFLFTSYSYIRRGRVIRMIDTARMIDVPRIVDGLTHPSNGEYNFDEFMNSGEYVSSESMDSEDPAIILYTSGTTGKPKGTVHVHGGTLVNVTKEVCFYTDMNESDTIFWVTDLGWMMGPWEIIGANTLKGTVFLYDGAMDYPDKYRLWNIIEKNKVSILGISPTLIRMYRYDGINRPMDGVRVFASTGEPWDEETWLYLFNVIGKGKIPISNISGGTDIIGCFLASNPAIPLKPTCLFRGLGMNVSVFDDGGNEIYNKIGYLVARKPSPSMTRGIWGDYDRYIETYWSRFNGVWFHGDWAMMDEDGYFYLYGRSDDVIKVAGKRVGPGEVENIVMEVEGVEECAVIGVPDRMKGEAIAVFYTGTESENVEDQIRLKIESAIGKPFSPKYVINLNALPKTRNGKIMRRIIKSVFTGKDPGDVSNMDDTSVIDDIKEKYQEINKEQ